MAETMVERAAKAHYERLHYSHWEYLTPSIQAGYIGAMRAAIEALRRMPGPVHRAAHTPLCHLFAEEADAYAASGEVWAAAIDAILKEQGNG